MQVGSCTVLYSYCDIELVATNFQLIVCPSCVTDHTSVGIATSGLSTDKQAVTHCLDIVYGYNTAGRHLIVGLAKTFVYTCLRTLTLVYGPGHWSMDIDVGHSTSRAIHTPGRKLCIKKRLYSLYAFVIIVHNNCSLILLYCDYIIREISILLLFCKLTLQCIFICSFCEPVL